MAQLTINYNTGWSYNAQGRLNTIGTFNNPSRSERAEISSITVNIGTISGWCTAGDTVYGNGSAISTYIQVGSTNSATVSVSKVVNVTGRPSYSYPIRNQMTAYTFTFSPAVSVGAGSSATVKIWCPSLGDNQLLGYDDRKGVRVTYQNIPNIQPTPTSVTISCTNFTATSISWKVTTGSAATSCRVYLDNSVKDSKGMRGNQATGTMNSVSSTVHSIKADAMNVNSSWVGSNTVRVDCTIPPINNLSINPLSSNTGALHFTSTYNVNYTLVGSDGVTYATGQVNANTDPSARVSLKNNSLTTYTLKIARKDNTKITNSKSTGNVDTRVANITLSGDDEGILYTFTAKSTYSCNNWIYYLQDTVTGMTTQVSYYSGSTTSNSRILTNLIPNRNYRLYVTANTVSSGLRITSNTITFKVNGCARIYDNGEFKVITPYVYDSSAKVWRQVIPYVWNGSEWEICV